MVGAFLVKPALANETAIRMPVLRGDTYKLNIFVERPDHRNYREPFGRARLRMTVGTM